MRVKSQNGNVLIYLLLALFLLGALTIVFSKTSSKTEETGSTERGTVKASEFLRTAGALQAGYQMLISRGCSESTVSFWQDTNDDGVEDATDANYNAGSPSDKSCHMFLPNGAGLKTIDKSHDLFVPAQILNVGTTSNDLYFVAEYEYEGATLGISEATCDAINKSLGNGILITSLPQADLTVAGFTGSYAAGAVLGDDVAESGMAGIKSGCIIDTGCGGGTCNAFYSTIVVR